MIEKIEGIVLNVVKHNDSHNVVTLYSRRRGRMAFLVPVGKSKSGRMRNAILSLMAIVGAEVNFKEGKELYNLRRVEPLRLWHSIYSNPVKSALLFFIAEFSTRLLRQYPPEEKMWRYLTGALQRLEDSPTSSVANFHIAFLVGMLSVAGIEPHTGHFEKGDRFDMISGEFGLPGLPEIERRHHFLDEKESALVPLLSRINFRNMTRYRFSRAERNHVLDRLLEYYAFHLPIGADFKTLPVLRESFG